MEADQKTQLMALYSNRFPVTAINEVNDKLDNLDYSFACAYLAQMKDPTIALILSILVGAYGVDRIYVGDVGLGILKLLTCGGLGIWWIVDLFYISDLTRTKNYETLMMM
ncbi:MULTISPECIES: TM2 domain-containing protein [Prevotella]|uniref:TM2 domain-containing protein n=1 Tax=Prevotella herbatica TaxID=2801997 RepID=A0ABM7NYH0_9BACT|nr:MULTISPECIES: TM2 domain-containing protein [Prevotella]MDN5552664.1 TM2 domain-containing protein [Prevotella sp.]BCS85469.1 TM2 domain-containing protein [Prevotella herbatica]